jgi:uncharacterized protein (TIGR00730 family)
MPTVLVYCASSNEIPDVYLKQTSQLGKLLALEGYPVVFGAGNSGLMGQLADSVLENCGIITGVIPKFMKDNGWHHEGLSDLIVTETIHERKNLMAKMSDAVVALPGGCGTLEELMEIITWKQLGLFRGPIIIANINRYYDELLKMLGHCVEDGFMKSEHQLLWNVANEAQAVLTLLKQLVV